MAKFEREESWAANIPDLSHEQLVVERDVIHEAIMEATFEERVQGTLLFICNTPDREVAEFIVYQGDAVDGLRKNIEAYTKEFRKMYNKQLDDDAQKAEHPSA